MQDHENPARDHLSILIQGVPYLFLNLNQDYLHVLNEGLDYD
jgi:hypothetical protein